MIINKGNTFLSLDKLPAEKNGKEKERDKIRFALECLIVCLGKGSYSERIFWKAYGEIKGIDIALSKENSSNLSKILMIMQEAEGIEIRDGTNMRYYLEKGKETKFFVPLDGLDTVKESIRMILFLKNSDLKNDQRSIKRKIKIASIITKNNFWLEFGLV